MTFIQLHDKHTGDPLFISLAHIVLVNIHSDGGSTVTFTGSNWNRVSEDYKTVVNLINKARGP